MAEVLLNYKIDTADSAKSISALTKSLKDLKSLQERYGQEGTKGFEKLSDAINKTEGRLGDLNDRFNTLRGSGVERLNTSVGLLTEGFQSFDTDKIKIGLQGLGSAMSAIPIFLLVEGLKLLAENAKELFDWFNEITDSGKSLESQLKNMKKENELLSASFQNQITALEGIKGNEEAIYKIKGQLIAQSKEEAKLALAIAIQKENDAKNEYTWKQRLLQAVGASAVAELDKVKVVKEASEERIKAENAVGKVIAEGIKQDNERTQKQIDNNKKLSEDRKKQQEEEEKNKQARIDRFIKEGEERANTMIAQFEEEEALKAKNEAEVMAEFDRITKEVQRIADMEYDVTKENNKKLLDEKKKHEDEIRALEQAAGVAAQQVVVSTMALSDLAFLIKSDKIKKGSEEEIQLAKRQFDINKKLQIAQAVASGLSGIVNILGAKTLIPEPFGSIAKGLQVAGFVTATATNIAKIERLQFDASSFSATAPPSNGGGSVGSGANLPPQQQQTINTNSQLFGGVNPNQQGGTNNPNTGMFEKVIVLEVGDVNAAQTKVATIQAQAKF